MSTPDHYRSDENEMIDALSTGWAVSRPNLRDLIRHSPVTSDMSFDEAVKAASGYIEHNTFCQPIYKL